jgi:LPS O-antigen subunit length determinant protein (WzzB/FepE family)
MSEQQLTNLSKPIVDDEIDILAMIRTLWNGRKTVIISVVAGAILGVTIALFSPNEYTATTVMVPQMGGDNQSKLGNFGGLAAMAGINLDMNPTAELSPQMYPQIVNSIPFQLELMNTKLDFQEYAVPITLFDYYFENLKTTVIGTVLKYTIGLPGVLIAEIKGKPRELRLFGDSINHPILLSEKQYKLKKMICSIVSLDYNIKEGYLTLTTRMPEALAAAQLAQKAQILLQRHITEFKIEKAKSNLDFIYERYIDAKTEFEKAQVSLAVVNDRNKNFTSGLPHLEIDRIQTRYTIAFAVFQDLAKQLEQAKIQVKKETPVFTTIEPVTVPLEKSGPNRSMILFIWLFLGGIFGIGIIFGKEYIWNVRKRWKEL